MVQLSSCFLWSGRPPEMLWGTWERRQHLLRSLLEAEEVTWYVAASECLSGSTIKNSQVETKELSEVSCRKCLSSQTSSKVLKKVNLFWFQSAGFILIDYLTLAHQRQKKTYQNLGFLEEIPGFSSLTSERFPKGKLTNTSPSGCLQCVGREVTAQGIHLPAVGLLLTWRTFQNVPWWWKVHSTKTLHWG